MPTPNTMHADLRSPVWLEASFRHARDYQNPDNLAQELISAKAVDDALRHIFITMSNRQLRETGDSASRWITDLIKCEEECGELSDDLKQTKIAMQVICDMAQAHRLHRSISKNGVRTYRRQ